VRDAEQSGGNTGDRYDLRLIDDIILSTGPESVTKGLKCLRPALQYLPGELRVENGTLLPIQCAHNTVRLRFDVERAEYMHLAKPDASFPRYQFNLLADSVRNEAYYGAPRLLSSAS
jgi:protein arginine N-methyltransferase 7